MPKQHKVEQKRIYHNEHKRRDKVCTTTGKSKNIVATAIQKSYCKRNRSWKCPKYGSIMASLGKRATSKA